MLVGMAAAQTPPKKEPMKTTGWDKFSAIILNPVLDSGRELTALFPDSILFGSLLLYIITQNISFGVLSVFSLEMSLLHKLTSFVYTKTVGSPKPDTSQKSPNAFAAEMRCHSGYKAARLEYERIFMGDTSPSVSMFFWGGLSSYLTAANFSFYQVLTSMKQEWWTRLIVSTVGLILLTLVFFLGRSGCESFGESMVAFIIGIVAGIACYVINLNVFGLEGINFNGLPYLENKTEKGSPVYVCAPPQA
jgi:hypothetical protein